MPPKRSSIDLTEELADLQYQMGQVDLLTRPPRGTDPDYIEFLVVILQNIKIRMDANKNHRRPHVHVDYGKNQHMASYAIDTGERLAGELALKYDRVVKEFIDKCRPKLMQIWQLAQDGRDAQGIIYELRAEKV